MLICFPSVRRKALPFAVVLHSDAPMLVCVHMCVFLCYQIERATNVPPNTATQISNLQCALSFHAEAPTSYYIILPCRRNTTRGVDTDGHGGFGRALLQKKRSKKDAAKRVVGAQRGHKINITIIIIFIITTNLCMCIHAFLCRPGRFGSRAAAGPPAKPHTRLCRCGEAVAVFLLFLAIHCAFFLH